MIMAFKLKLSQEAISINPLEVYQYSYTRKLTAESTLSDVIFAEGKGAADYNREVRREVASKQALYRSMRRVKNAQNGIVEDKETAARRDLFLFKTLEKKPSIKQRLSEGLVSNSSKQLFFTIQRTPRCLFAGYAPETLIEHAPGNKLFALDLPWIRGNDRMRGMHAINLNGTFNSKQDVRALVASKGVTQPQIIVGQMINGKFCNPTLIWNYLDAVNFSRRGLASCKRFWAALDRGLRYAFRDCGVDLNADPLVFKNPMCDAWSVDVNSDELYTMGQVAEGLDLTVSNMSLYARSENVSPYYYKLVRSQGLYNALLKVASNNIFKYKQISDKNAFRSEVSAYANILGKETNHIVTTIAKQVTKIVDYMWMSYDQSKARSRFVSGTGPLADICRGMTIKQAQAEGARHTNAKQRKYTTRLIKRGVLSLIRNGASIQIISAKQVAKEINNERCERTVRDYLMSVKSEISAETIEKSKRKHASYVREKNNEIASDYEMLASEIHGRHIGSDASTPSKGQTFDRLTNLWIECGLENLPTERNDRLAA